MPSLLPSTASHCFLTAEGPTPGWTPSALSSCCHFSAAADHQLPHQPCTAGQQEESSFGCSMACFPSELWKHQGKQGRSLTGALSLSHMGALTSDCFPHKPSEPVRTTQEREKRAEFENQPVATAAWFSAPAWGLFRHAPKALVP